MANEMLRIAGRGTDGTAKPIKTDNNGNIGTTISGTNVGQKRTVIGDDFSLLPAESRVILDNHEFKDGVTAWALYGFVYNRGMSAVASGLKLTIEMSTQSGSYGESTSGKIVFRQVVSFAEMEELFGSGIAVNGNPARSDRTSVILAGNYFNIPIGKYMRLTITNELTASNMNFHPFVLLEEGVL